MKPSELKAERILHDSIELNAQAKPIFSFSQIWFWAVFMLRGTAFVLLSRRGNVFGRSFMRSRVAFQEKILLLNLQEINWDWIKEHNINLTTCLLSIFLETWFLITFLTLKLIKMSSIRSKKKPQGNILILSFCLSILLIKNFHLTSNDRRRKILHHNLSLRFNVCPNYVELLISPKIAWNKKRRAENPLAVRFFNCFCWSFERKREKNPRKVCLV